MKRRLALASLPLLAVSLMACTPKDEPGVTSPIAVEPSEDTSTSSLDSETLALLEDLKTVRPIFESYVKDKDYTGGGAPIGATDIPGSGDELRKKLESVEFKTAVYYNYGGGNGDLQSLELTNEAGAIAGLDEKGLFVVPSVNEENASSPDFTKVITGLQSSIESYIEANDNVPGLDQDMKGKWSLTPGFFGDEEGPTVPLDLPEDLESAGAESSGPEEWTITLRDGKTGDLGKVSSDGASFGIVQRVSG